MVRTKGGDENYNCHAINGRKEKKRKEKKRKEKRMLNEILKSYDSYP